MGKDYTRWGAITAGGSPLGLERTDDLLIGRKIDLALKTALSHPGGGGYGYSLQKSLDVCKKIMQKKKLFFFCVWVLTNGKSFLLLYNNKRGGETLHNNKARKGKIERFSYDKRNNNNGRRIA